MKYSRLTRQFDTLRRGRTEILALWGTQPLQELRTDTAIWEGRTAVRPYNWWFKDQFV